MRIFFVLSATLWSYFVARCITFGPRPRGLWWCPRMHADTWYRLTPMPKTIDHRGLTYIPCIIALLAIPALTIDHDIIHVVTVLRLVAEHAFVPIFVAHVHAESCITAWALCNTLAAGGSIYLYTFVFSTAATLAIAAGVCSLILHLLFVRIQLYLCCVQAPIRHQQVYEERQPRLV